MVSPIEFATSLFASQEQFQYGKGGNRPCNGTEVEIIGMVK
jgi:hypothetical protein